MTSEFTIALHALVCLERSGEMMDSELLAKKLCTNPVRVRKVMAKLRRAGLVDTREGVGGGYHAARPAQAVTLRQVCEAVEREIVPCGRHSREMDRECLVAAGMAAVMEEISAGLNEACAAWLSGMTVRDVERRIFDEKDDKQKVRGEEL